MSAPQPEQAPLPLSLPGVSEPKIGDRGLFPDLKMRAYLAHGAISPASTATVGMVRAVTDSVARLGVASFPIWMAQRERLRREVADLVHVQPTSIALTSGCTAAITNLALALPWHQGDRLLTYRGEFPANVIPWQLASRARGGDVELLELPDPKQKDAAARLLSELEDRLALSDRTPWVAVSAVQFQTGFRMPIKEMADVCHRYGSRLFVDGIQGCGVVPVDLSIEDADAYITGAHKWLLGLEGAGFAYLKPDLMEELLPLTAGWLSFPDAEHFLFRGAGHLRYDRQLLDTPRVFEGGTANAVGFAALEAGVAVLRKLGAAGIYEHVQTYHDAIEQALEELGLVSLRAIDPNSRSCILSFKPPSSCDVSSVLLGLRARGVAVSTPDGLIRLAPHFANSLDEVPFVIEAFREALSR